MKSLIEQLKKAALAATPGPWFRNDDDPPTFVRPLQTYYETGEPITADFFREEDAHYITLCSPENILKLCAALESKP